MCLISSIRQYVIASIALLRHGYEDTRQGRAYKKTFALLPTVDHVGDGTGSPNFQICGWRTNDSKSDLDLAEFLALCRRLLKHSDRKRRRRR